jgi:hypothetical protein
VGAAASGTDLPKKLNLMAAMNREAGKILELAAKDTTSIETRLLAFDKVARWMQISNRIPDSGEEGLLDAYRERIDTAESEVAEREAHRIKSAKDPGHDVRRNLGKHQRAAKNAEGGNGGPALEALKSRLPATNDGNADDHRGGGGGEGLAIAGANRIVHADLPGNTDTRFDESHSSDEF